MVAPSVPTRRIHITTLLESFPLSYVLTPAFLSPMLHWRAVWMARVRRGRRPEASHRMRADRGDDERSLVHFAILSREEWEA